LKNDVYCHLHTHSYYSFLEGLPSPGNLAKAAAAAGMPALGMTDYLGLTGALSFYRACRDLNIKPILGLEIDLALPFSLSPSPMPQSSGRLALLAMDDTGWRSLCRLSSRLLVAQETGQISLCSLADLDRDSTSLICMTGGCLGPLQHLLNEQNNDDAARSLMGQLAEIFSGRMYVELHQQTATDKRSNPKLVQLAVEMGLPLVAGHAVFYLEKEQAAFQRTVSAIRHNCPLSRLPSQWAAPPESWFIAPERMMRKFAAMPEALLSVDEIVSRCNLDLAFNKPHYPNVPVPEGMSAIELLRQKAEDGARRLYGKITPAIKQRLESELTIIAARGYEPIFLIAEEMVSFAQKQGIPFASRGSASSSLVAHCAGVTTPDPLALDLYFERFLNPTRTTPPDIDTDFCSHRRDEVIRHLFEVYQPEQVAMVGTINTFRPRSAINEVAKAHGFKPTEVRALAGRVTRRGWGPPVSGDPSIAPVEGPPVPNRDASDAFAELNTHYGHSPRHAIVISEATALLGMPHHLSVHPGGVVIAPGHMIDFVPVTHSSGKDVTITQFGLDDVERIGLIKLDLLGIRGLTVLGDVADQVHSWRQKEFNNVLSVLDSVPPDDPKVAALISGGQTIGCFQIESPGMRSTLRSIQACCADDIMAALALYRPGPLKGGLRDAFIRRHNHQESVSHIHPSLSRLLEDTYGVILYQEQVLRIAHELAGLSLAEADLLRRAMSHFDPGRQMQLLKEKFVEGAGTRANIPPETAQHIWEMMAAFAGYGFPKAHAASYAQVAWRSAWCKAHYPAEFIAAVLANRGGYYPQSVYLSEARRLGLAVRPPHVNHGQPQFSVIYPSGDPVLYMGLDQVRGLTRRTQERILRLRPFHNLTDFLIRVDPRQQEVENLIQTGAFEGLGAIPELLRELSSGQTRPGQLTLFALHTSTGEDWDVQQKANAQRRLLGISLEAHPLKLQAEAVKESGALTTVEASEKIGEIVRVAGTRQTLFRSQTTHGEWMAFMTLEDLEGMLDIVFFPAIYRRTRSLLSGDSDLLLVEGILERDSHTGEPVLQAQRVWPLQ